MDHPAIVRRRQAGAELPGDLDRLLLREAADPPQQRRPGPRRRCTPSSGTGGRPPRRCRRRGRRWGARPGGRSAPRRGTGRAAAGSSATAARQELQRDGLPEREVVGAVDLAHAAAAEEADDAVALGQQGAGGDRLARRPGPRRRQPAGTRGRSRGRVRRLCAAARLQPGFGQRRFVARGGHQRILLIWLRHRRIGLTSADGALCCAARMPMPLGAQLAHHVFFWLKNPDSIADRDALIEGVRALAAIPAIRALHVGVPAGVEPRPVVDSSYSVLPSCCSSTRSRTRTPTRRTRCTRPSSPASRRSGPGSWSTTPAAARERAAANRQSGYFSKITLSTISMPSVGRHWSQ